MLRTRVIPSLLIQDRKLVKTINFKKPKYIGDPINAVRIFNQKEVDELILLDISCNKLDVPINFSFIEKVASECFMPLSYGGGVRSLNDYQKLFKVGIEKVSVCTLLFENPDIVKGAVSQYGSQSVVACLDINLGMFRKKYKIRKRCGSGMVNMGVVEAAQYACELGVGEIIVNTIHREGTWAGFDVDLIRTISDSVEVPVIALGGAGSLSDIGDVVKNGKASAVALGSMVVFQGKDMGVLVKFPKSADLQNLFKK